jgi:hypothetical protein
LRPLKRKLAAKKQIEEKPLTPIGYHHLVKYLPSILEMLNNITIFANIKNF